MAKRSFNWMHAALALAVLASVALAAPPAPPRTNAPSQQPQAQPGQQVQQPQQAPQRFGAPGQQGQRITTNRPVEGAMNPDHTIAECLGISNQEEVALANIALAKVENSKVREFAETLVKDHSDLLAQLHKFGAQTAQLNANENANTAQTNRGANFQPGRNLPGQAGRDTAQAPRGPNEPRTERTGRVDAQGNTVGGNQGQLDFLAIKRQIAQRCVASAQKELSEYKGTEVDMVFVGQQIVLHQQMLDAAHVLRKHASPELQAVIDKGIESTQMHLDQAKSLIKSLDRERDSDKSSDKS